MSTRQYGGRIDLQCERCGHHFTRKASRLKDHVFCSRACYFASDIPTANAIKATRTRFPDGGIRDAPCTHCGKIIQRYRSQALGKVFCSQPCIRAHSLAVPARQVTSAGYIKIFVGHAYPGANKSGHILEHRKVVQDLLGRPLLPEENVHHKNGVRDDNRPANLELWSKSQPCGQRVEDKLAWAREFIAQYEDKPLI